MMKGRRYSEEQILRVLKEVEGGATMAAVARSHGVNVQTISRWRERFQGMTKSELVELRRIQDENRRLRNVVARQALHIEALEEVAKGKW